MLNYQGLHVDLCMHLFIMKHFKPGVRRLSLVALRYYEPFILSKKKKNYIYIYKISALIWSKKLPALEGKALF